MTKYLPVFKNIFSVFSAVSLETLVENCHKLLEKFHYSWEMMPLVLVILNYAGSDLDEASRKIDEGKKPSEGKCCYISQHASVLWYIGPYVGHGRRPSPRFIGHCIDTSGT